MHAWNKILLLTSFSALGFIASEAIAQKGKPIGKPEAKTGVLTMPAHDKSEKAPAPLKKKSKKSMAETSKLGSDDPCARLTPAAIQAAIDEMQSAVDDGEQNLIAHDPAEYAAAGQYAVVYFKQARDEIISLQTWLNDINVASPYVSNLSAAYSVHWYARDAASTLAYGEHWAGISAVYNTSTQARSAAEHGAVATELLADIGADGMRCYIQGYVP